MKQVAKKIKRTGLHLAGFQFWPTPQIKCDTKRFGSEYGGWNVATRGLDRSSIVYSFGVGNDISFEQAKAFLSALIQRDPDSVRMVTASAKEWWDGVRPRR